MATSAKAVMTMSMNKIVKEGKNQEPNPKWNIWMYVKVLYSLKVTSWHVKVTLPSMRNHLCDLDSTRLFPFDLLGDIGPETRTQPVAVSATHHSASLRFFPLATTTVKGRASS